MNGDNGSTFVLKDGQQKGPFENDVLLACMKGGVLLDSDLAWKEGQADWIPLGDFVAKHITGAKFQDVTPPPIPVVQTTIQEALPKSISGSKFVAIGECDWVPGADKRMAGRNLQILDAASNRVVFSFVENPSSIGGYVAKRTFGTSAGEHSSFETDVSYMGEPFGKIKGRLSSKLLDRNGKVRGRVKQKTILTSFTLLKKYSVALLGFVIATIVLISFLHDRMIAHDFASVGRIKMMVVGFVYLLFFRWLLTRRRAMVYNGNGKLICEVRRQGMRSSQRSFQFVRGGRNLGELSKPVDADEMKRLLGLETDPSLGTEGERLASQYDREAVGSMSLSEKVKLARKVVEAGNLDVKNGSISGPTTKKTTLRAIRFSEPVCEEDRLALFSFIYLAFISTDCEGI